MWGDAWGFFCWDTAKPCAVCVTGAYKPITLINEGLM